MSGKSKLAKVGDWLDERTGFRALLGHALDEPVRGGARYAYVFGSVLTVGFAMQVATGLGLMTGYSPSTQTAWSSVHWLSTQMAGGWLVRGLHHFGASAVVIVLGLHLLQTALFGAYKKPRELNWLLGLGLFGVTLGFALTGYLLPWDQKGYWATKVATNIAGTIPGIGPRLQALALGGSDYSSLTLTRFYALHVGVLPLTALFLFGAHIALFRKHGVTPPASADLKKRDSFFPKQLGKDVVAAAIFVAAVFYLAYRSHGAPLDAPADPASEYPARPEWYFLSLFELLKYLHGPLELLGTVGLPTIAGAYLAALPFVDKKPGAPLTARLKFLAPLAVGAVGAVGLTLSAQSKDARDKSFQEARVKADAEAARAHALAARGIGPEGPLAMMKNDPEARGAALFGKHCASCHVLAGLGSPKDASAPALDGWGTEAWVVGLLDDPDHEARFGKTPFKGMMPSMTRCKPGDAACKPMSPDDVKAVASFLASQAGEPVTDAARARAGESIAKTRCTACHLFRGEGDDGGEGTAPELAAWGSIPWIRAQIDDPSSRATYREKALTHGAEVKGGPKPMPKLGGQIAPADVDLLARWVHAKARGQKL
ncbi:MAG: cytochrome b N-terminal domain-containing protein [Myxococcales bacterium]|nr:cytochrome b N-terminal domain-containing protein [Myxococcales bacterium]